MKSLNKFFLMVILWIALAAPVWADDPSELKSLIHFKNTGELLSYIANQNGLENDSEVILKLALDSQVDYHGDSDGVPDIGGYYRKLYPNFFI